MSTLSKRATPRQAVVLRMIEGACRNAAHAHPGQVLDDRLARSIAKRAAGTLTAQWPSVLAAPKVRSEGDARHVRVLAANGGGNFLDHRRGSAVDNCSPRSAGASYYQWRAPLQLLWKSVGKKIGEARRAGQTERAETLIEVARDIAKMLDR